MRCPDWCRETHDHRELVSGHADHAVDLFHDDESAASVGLYQNDDNAPQILADPGPNRFLAPAQARRFAEAIGRALDLLDGSIDR